MSKDSYLEVMPPFNEVGYTANTRTIYAHDADIPFDMDDVDWSDNEEPDTNASKNYYADEVKPNDVDNSASYVLDPYSSPPMDIPNAVKPVEPIKKTKFSLMIEQYQRAISEAIDNTSSPSSTPAVIPAAVAPDDPAPKPNFTQMVAHHQGATSDAISNAERIQHQRTTSDNSSNTAFSPSADSTLSRNSSTPTDQEDDGLPFPMDEAGKTWAGSVTAERLKKTISSDNLSGMAK
jgi:hypothetical protein